MAKPRTENMGGSDQEILARAKCTIEIAGRTYEWTEMGRRQAREALAEILPLLHAYNPNTSPPDMLLLINKTLDFFYKYHARMNGDRKHIDSDATNNEISTALLAVRAVIDAPFRRDAAPDLEAETTSTPSPESSNS